MQRGLYRAAKQALGRRFALLYSHIYKEETLTEAWKRVSAKDGSPGVDDLSIATIKENGYQLFLEKIQKELQDGTYRANKIKRVYINKTNGEKRPLGIPTVRDRVVQMAVKIIIEPLFEADFKKCSHGFRPKHDNKRAAQITHQYSNYYKWVVDVDLRKYFDSIDHDTMMCLLEKRINDRRILRLIRYWLKAGVLENSEIIEPECGTAQGGVISPLLSNIYLNEIDKLWVDNSTVKLVRFADDMVFMCRSELQAKWVLRKLKTQLAEMKLTLNEEKTKIRHVSQSFDFIGFTYKEAWSKRLGKLVRIKFPRAKSVQKFRAELKKCVKMEPLGTDLKEIIAKVNIRIRGWINYFKIGNSYKQALEISQYACEQLRIQLRRKRGRKRTRCYTKWPDNFFYKGGLYYAPYLLRNKTNAA